MNKFHLRDEGRGTANEHRTKKNKKGKGGKIIKKQYKIEFPIQNIVINCLYLYYINVIEQLL